MTKKNQQRMVKAWTANDITFHTINIQVAVKNYDKYAEKVGLANLMGVPDWMTIIDSFSTELELYFKPVGDGEAFYNTKDEEIHNG